MKKIFCMMFLFWNTLNAQQYSWVFGYGCGMNVAVYPPTVILGGKTGTGPMQEGTATLSIGGNLAFYTGGSRVWTRTHTVMHGGDTLMGGPSATQSSLIVPYPGHEAQYFLFTVDDFLHNLQNGFRYSIINMCANSEQGEVDSLNRNVPIFSTVSEKLCGIQHANGSDYWIMVHTMTDSFLVFPLTSSGLGAPVISKVGTIHSDTIGNTMCAIGQMKFSPDGSKGALSVGNRNDSYIELFDFDKTTGVVSNCRIVDQVVLGQGFGNFYGACFSENSCYLFTSDAVTGEIRSYNVCAGSDSLIKASRHTLGSLSCSAGGMERAENGIVYVSYYCGQLIGGSIAAIESANTAPVLRDSVAVFTGTTSLGLSYFLDDYSYPETGLHCTTTGMNDGESVHEKGNLIHIYSMDGKRFAPEDVPFLPKGIYVGVFETETKRYTQKLGIP